MQSKTSYFNKTIFKKNIGHFWPIWTAYLLLLLLLEPFTLFLQTGEERLLRQGAEISTSRIMSFADVLKVVSNPLFLFVIALISAMAVFYYMYQTKNCNMIHSLPVNRTELFLTNYLSGFLFMVIPQIISFLVTVFVCLGRGITDLGCLLWSHLVMIGIVFFAYSLAVCVGMLTGQFVTMPIFFVLANGIVMGLEVLVRMLIGCFTYGLGMSISPTFSRKFTPVYYMWRNLHIDAYTNEGESTLRIATSGGKMVACYAAVGLVLAVAAYLLYRKKRLESVGDFIAVKGLKPVFRWGSAVCFAILAAVLGASIANDMSGSSGVATAIVVAIIIGILVFFIAEMLLQKKFKVFTKKKFTECAAMLAVTLIVIIGVKADFLGQENYVPKTDDIEKVRMNSEFAVYADGKKDIERIREIHKMILENKDDITNILKEEGDSVCYVGFQYRLKNGKVVQRSYNIPATTAYYKQKDSVLHRLLEIQNEYDNYMAGIFGPDYENKKPIAAHVTTYNVINDQEDELALESSLVQELYDAVAADVKEGHMKIEPYDGGSNKEYYYNTIRFSMYTDKAAAESQNNNYTESQQTNEVWIDFSKDCTHIIEVLNKANVFNEVDLLLTCEEFDEIQENANMQ